MNLELVLMSDIDIAEFKRNIQYAFQKGFEDVFGKCEETILPEKDIDQSLNGKGAAAYKAVLEGEKVSARQYGLQLKSYTRIQRYGKHVLRILKNEIFIFM